MKETHACSNVSVGKYSRVVLLLWSPYKVLPELPPIVWYLVVRRVLSRSLSAVVVSV